MEDFQLDIVLGKGPAARSIRLDLPRFTLVGATTRTGLITGPLRDRFGFVARVDYYDRRRPRAIILARPPASSASTSTPTARDEIARRARGTPRIANRLLKRVRDFAEVRGDGTVTADGARRARALRGRRARPRQGRPGHPRPCATLRRRTGRPVHLAVSVGEEPETVEDVYEPFLLQQGLLMRTPRGRVATAAAWAHLGLAAPGQPPGLFD